MEKYNVSKSTVMRVWKRRQEILEHVSCLNDHKHIMRRCLYRPALEVRMLEWVEFVRSKKIKLIINYGALLAAAKKISTKLLKSPPADLSDLNPNNRLQSQHFPLFSVIIPCSQLLFHCKQN